VQRLILQDQLMACIHEIGGFQSGALRKQRKRFVADKA
jgi:hypothetical protein